LTYIYTMEIDQKNVSKLELMCLLTRAQKTISAQDKTIAKQDADLRREREKSAELQRQLELLRRMQFGQKRERFEDPNQMTLPLDVEQEVLQEQEEVI